MATLVTRNLSTAHSCPTAIPHLPLKLSELVKPVEPHRLRDHCPATRLHDLPVQSGRDQVPAVRRRHRQAAAPRAARQALPDPAGGEWATRDMDRVIAAWTHSPAANPAIACAPSGLLVVDCDIAKDEYALREMRQRYSGDWDELNNTYRVQTGSFGLHVYYRWPAGLKASQASPVKGLLDVRGNGGEQSGYVLAAGAVTSKGRYIAENAAPVRNAPALAGRTVPRETRSAPAAVRAARTRRHHFRPHRHGAQRPRRRPEFDTVPGGPRRMLRRHSHRRRHRPVGRRIHGQQRARRATASRVHHHVGLPKPAEEGKDMRRPEVPP
ncbi:bifunctional DNA primase/polymerase [Streptomyces sp. NPDC053750]|uniref:bifunctional DNA primase/polymerase n=1 Tax=Streptomyces sp. NPDC053750 TaxID=3365714 RepID=UPI0037D1975F